MRIIKCTQKGIGDSCFQFRKIASAEVTNVRTSAQNYSWKREDLPPREREETAEPRSQESRRS